MINILSVILTLNVLAVGSECMDPAVASELERLSASDSSSVSVTVVPVEEVFGKLKTARWDVIVLDPEHASLAPRLRGKSQDTDIYVHQPWAYARTYFGDPSVDPRFKEYDCDQKKMYAAITARTKEAVKKYRLSVIPVGTAVQNVRATFDRDNITRDGVRLNSPLGTFVAAATWYEALTGKDATQLDFNPGRMREERRELALGAAHAANSHPWEVTDYGFRKLNKNYDEAKVPEYTLPDALTMQDGRRVETPEQWYAERRPELLHLFETEMFGKVPPRPSDLHFKVIEEDHGIFGGTATRKQINIYFTEGEDHYMTLLLYTPNQVTGPVPVFLGANFKGNVTINPDPAVLYPDDAQIRRYQVYTECARGCMSNRWPLGMILASGYGLATFCKNDMDPEFDDGFQNGVHGLFYREGQDYPEPDEWGSISAWSWGYSRAIDYLETDPGVDARKIAVIGHSRLAKTALWTAARDERVAMAFPNNPGCCGAAISRRGFGESLETIIRHYHYWFCGNFAKYACNEDMLPFDQHELLSLVAPRPLYVGSGEYDSWSDPKGEFIGLLEASKVYEFLGVKGLGVTDNPGPWKPVSEGYVGYHMRSGPHDMTSWDWYQYIRYADKYLKQSNH